MTSTIHADKIMNYSGDQDSGLDLQTNDQVKLKTANTDRVTVTDATTTVANDLAAATIKTATVKHTGGTTGLTIDSSGRVLKSVIPRFSVYRSTSSEQYVNTSNSASVNVVINFANAEINVGSHFDLSNNKFTAPITGTYRFDYHMLTGLLIPSSGVYWAVYLLTKNGGSAYTDRLAGTPYSYVESYNSSGSSSAGESVGTRHFIKVVGGGFADLTAGDYVQLMMQASNNSNVRVHSGVHSTWTGYLIG